MAELVGKYRVYSEFFTNLAVAWISAGVLSPAFGAPRDLAEVIPLVLFGSWGAWISLEGAVFFSNKGDRNDSY